MIHPPLDKMSKKRSLGVHVKMSTENFLRKMLSISVNRKDGGVMVVPHLQEWGEIISSRLLVTEGGGLLPDEGTYVRSEGENKPKLHYHRSGMSSVQPQGFTGGRGRKTIHLPSLQDLDGVQIFSVIARMPGHLPKDQKVNPGDIVSYFDLPSVCSLKISAVIYDRRAIPQHSIGGFNKTNPVTFASDHNNASLVDLSGYGLEAVLVLYFDPSPWEVPDFAADFSLVSFHQDRLGTDGAVAIHAGPGIPVAALMQPVPSVASVHNINALRPVASFIQNKRPQSP